MARASRVIMKKTVRWFSIVPVLLLVVAGCGRRDLEPLSGTVMFSGEPLRCGVIVFVTADSSGIEAAAPPTTSGIQDGQFSIPKQYGLKQGNYRVTIRGYEGFPRGTQPLGFNIFKDYDTTFEYTGQKTAEFEVPTPRRPIKLPPPGQVYIDPSSPRM